MDIHHSMWHADAARGRRHLRALTAAQEKPRHGNSIAKHVEEEAQRLVKNGATHEQVAMVLRIAESTVDKVCRGMSPDRHAACTPTTLAERLAAKRDGEKSAQRGFDEDDCPYWDDQIALRCAWMAGFHDYPAMVARAEQSRGEA